MKHPQIHVTFSPNGELQTEIPGPNGSRCVIPIPPDQSPCYNTLCRLLRGQALDAAAEAWAIMRSYQSGKPYEAQLEDLSRLRTEAIKAKRHYQLVESQVGLLPVIKTTKPKSKNPKTTQTQSYHADFSDL